VAILTPEQCAKGGRSRAERLGPVGRAISARIAANARWGKPAKPKPVVRLPPAGWLLEALVALVEEFEGQPGYSLQAGKLSEVIAWVKEQR